MTGESCKDVVLILGHETCTVGPPEILVSGPGGPATSPDSYVPISAPPGRGVSKIVTPVTRGTISEGVNMIP